MNDSPSWRPEVVCSAHGDNQCVGGPHGEPDGEKESKKHQLGVRVFADVDEVGSDDIHHIPGQELTQGDQDCGDIQIQQAQQSADEDEEGEDHEE